MMIRRMTSSSKGDFTVDETGESDQISTESRLVQARDALLSVFEEMSLSRTLGVSTLTCSLHAVEAVLVEPIKSNHRWG